MLDNDDTKYQTTSSSEGDTSGVVSETFGISRPSAASGGTAHTRRLRKSLKQSFANTVDIVGGEIGRWIVGD
jgi:hypothetical protein